MGGGGIVARGSASKNSFRDALPRVDGARAIVAGREERTRVCGRSRERDCIFAARGAGERGQKLWHRGGAASGVAERGDYTRAGNSEAARRERRQIDGGAFAGRRAACAAAGEFYGD